MTAVDRESEREARAIEMFDQGKSINEVIVEIREASVRVRAWYEAWLDHGGAAMQISTDAKATLAEVVGEFSNVAELISACAASRTRKDLHRDPSRQPSANPSASRAHVRPHPRLRAARSRWAHRADHHPPAGRADATDVAADRPVDRAALHDRQRARGQLLAVSVRAERARVALHAWPGARRVTTAAPGVLRACPAVAGGARFQQRRRRGPPRRSNGQRDPRDSRRRAPNQLVRRGRSGGKRPTRPPVPLRDDPDRNGLRDRRDEPQRRRSSVLRDVGVRGGRIATVRRVVDPRPHAPAAVSPRGRMESDRRRRGARACRAVGG